jgi:hypothetical protein
MKFEASKRFLNLFSAQSVYLLHSRIVRVLSAAAAAARRRRRRRRISNFISCKRGASRRTAALGNDPSTSNG